MPAAPEGLPHAPRTMEVPLRRDWAHQPQWRVMELGTGSVDSFLSTWAAWQRDPQRPRLLHYVLVTPQRPDSTHATEVPTDPALHTLAQRLAPQLYGLLPGVHRISLEDGQVLLTLWLGDHPAMLRQQNSVVDHICASDPSVLQMPPGADLHLIKALARHCRRGTTLQADFRSEALPPAWQQCGFVQAAGHANTAVGSLRFDPAWEPRQRQHASAEPVQAPGCALVLGAGLAGSAVAHSLAVRGWQVTVLATGNESADGASGLPAGLFCPHVSPDDAVLSRISRNGVRLTQERLHQLCVPGSDWLRSGVLEHCTDGGTGLPTSWAHGPGADWSRPATAAELRTAGLPADTMACWHAQAGWVRPSPLVRAQLHHPNIRFQGPAAVHQLQRVDGQWQALDAQGHIMARADIAVLATGPATAQLLPCGVDWQLQPIRGQISWGLHTPENASALPPFPVNGNGNLVTQVPLAADTHAGAHTDPSARLWVMGSTFERDVTALPIAAADQAAAHAVNHGKLSTLLPASGAAMAPWFDPQDGHCQPTWGQVRVASHDRLPIVGPVGDAWPGLWASTAMGARGLTLSVLCGELLAARLHGEPLPLDSKLAAHLGTERLRRRSD